MKKLMSFLMCLLLLFLLGTNPSTSEFTSWYVDQCAADFIVPLPDQLCDAFAQFLESYVERSNYGFCSVYTFHGITTVGIADRFFPLDELSIQFEDLRSSFETWYAEFAD